NARVLGGALGEPNRRENLFADGLADLGRDLLRRADLRFELVVVREGLDSLLPTRQVDGLAEGFAGDAAILVRRHLLGGVRRNALNDILVRVVRDSYAAHPEHLRKTFCMVFPRTTPTSTRLTDCFSWPFPGPAGPGPIAAPSRR